MSRRTCKGLVGCALIAFLTMRAAAVDFARDIQPIFAEHCDSCHGSEKHKSGLRLDNAADALHGGDDGPAIRPAHSAESLLLKYVSGLDHDKIMPPKGARLTQAEIDALRSWIDAGAPWPVTAGNASNSPAVTHWAFRPPELRPPPACQNRRWIRNPIDSFILARLEKQLLTPSPEGDRATLIRRLSLDLLGLPPTPEEVSDFVADHNPGAYEHLVDRLLASPHFGERWGRHWLDLARYADSDGYQLDYFRPYAYLYRDWVVDSLNRDQPFDQFTIEQLAGDLLPRATTAQLIATGFHRNTLVNHEDGVDQAEFRVKAKVDRVGTTGTVWLGLTLGCCECHSHKYDPLTQGEFYQLYAFFNQAEETDVNLPDKRQIAAFRELTNAPPTCIHIRGDFLRPGPAVSPGTPFVLPAFHPRGARPDRLDLARWLVEPANPLTARVAVNRVWLHLFGRGLVATPGDFGTRGEPPSHPELLDWLAVTFAQSGPGGLAWSRKQLIRLMVTSAAYRQSSHDRAELAARDPDNILLARQNHFRVEAEAVRDLHLAASGLANPAIGGPPIRPPMPADLVKIGYVDRGIKWEESTGSARYRRGLYVQAQRTVPYPVPALFDGADPNEVCTRRAHSNTPLQALTLLNNQVFVECARALGQRMQHARLPNIDSRIARGFQLCLGRAPTRFEAARLGELFRVEMRSAGPKGESAAWMAVAQVLFNLDEFLTRE